MSIYDFTVKDIKGNDVPLSEYKGKVLLIVNTAPKSGLTPQYSSLEAIYRKFHAMGFEILDFPCNQFAFQAPWSDERIDGFCRLSFDTTFQRFAKIKVNGMDAIPLYKYLKQQKPGAIKWSFTKFLIDRNGNVIARYAPAQRAECFEEDVEELLEE